MQAGRFEQRLPSSQVGVVIDPTGINRLNSRLLNRRWPQGLNSPLNATTCLNDY